jgi:trehalose synthase
MAFLVDVEPTHRLADYAAVAHLVPAVRELEARAAAAADALRGRTIWMVNSTAQGGGVAEMLPTMILLLRDLGFQVEWAVIESDDPDFFRLTKQLHNLIHGSGNPAIEGDARRLYEQVNRDNARFLADRVRPGDIVVVHDPQPMALAGQLRGERDIYTIWRSHIGLDESNARTDAAWAFLAPYFDDYDHAVFSADDYIPDGLRDRSSLISPAINPLTAKSAELELHRLVGILRAGALAVVTSPAVPGPFAARAERLQVDGTFAPANLTEDIGVLTRPIVTQVSRWDRLKGFVPLMQAFARLKQRFQRGHGRGNGLHRRRLKLARLLLAGPDPASIQDDPEGREVLESLRGAYLDLDPAVQDDVAVVTLPMASLYENNLMVNAIQRASTVVVQNSLREGFGLTITEAMWKRLPVLSNRRACGPRQQIRDGIDGCLIDDPEDVDALASTIDAMLADPAARQRWGRTAQRRAHDEFLIFSQLASWLAVWTDVVGARPIASAG